MKKRLLFSLLIFLSLSSWAQLRINELMQSNVDCIMDDNNEFPDSWIEIYNTTTNGYNLSSFKIGLTDDVTTAYQLPSKTLAAHSYVVIYCDKDATGLHTNFKLDSDTTSVYLFSNGKVVDKIDVIPEQPAPNVSYGRKNETSDDFGFLTTPTPGAANCGQIGLGVLGNPVFSIPGYVKAKVMGSYDQLSLSRPDGSPSGCQIRYTTDGTEPTATSNLYVGQITLNKTTVVRARLFCDGYISPPSVCQSYIIHGRDVTLPVISITTDNKYFYDNKIGIYVDGTYNSSTKNYSYNWKRPANFEYFVPEEDESVVNQLCQTRITGGASRGCVLKSLGIYAAKRLGKKRLKYEFFPEDKPGLNKFKSIMIRNAGNDFDYLYFRDAAIQRMMARHADLDWQAYKPAIFYLNGTYMGMLNVRERSNEDNIWSNYDGLEDIDMIETYWSLKAGDWTAYNEFKEFITSHDHTYAEYDSLMDINEYQNLMLMNMLFNNLDFPGNNIVYWRPRMEGGKWRWIAKDVDYTMGLYNDPASYNYIEWLYNSSYDSNRNWGANSGDATRLFRRLMEIDQFKWEFLDKVAVYTGNFLSADSINNTLDQMADVISYEYPYHRNPINKWWPTYSTELSNAKAWNSARRDYFYQYLINKYSISGTLSSVIDNQLSEEDREKVRLTINNIPLSGGFFCGKFFSERQLTVTGSSIDPEKQVTGWSVFTVDKNGKVSNTTVDGATLTIDPGNFGQLNLNVILADVDGIDDVKASGSEVVAIYDTSGRQIPSLQRGVNIVKYADGTTRKVDVR